MTFEQGFKYVESYVRANPDDREVFDDKIKPDLEYTNHLLVNLGFTFIHSVIGTDYTFYWVLNFSTKGQAVMIEATIDSNLTGVKYFAWFRHRQDQLRADNIKDLLYQLGA